MNIFADPATCLALAIYWEARNQPTAGQVAVAQVVINRVNDDGFPDNVCDVVTQGPTYKSNPDLPVRHMCQFSFYCDGKSDDPKDHKSWDKAKYLSWRVVHNQSVDISDGALYYHADYVAPNWSITKEKAVRINNHVFYR